MELLIERFVVHLFESRVSDRDFVVLRATSLVRYDQDDKLMAQARLYTSCPFSSKGVSQIWEYAYMD